MTTAQRVFGLASYLLVATPLAAYGPGAHPGDPLYRLPLGSPNQGAPAAQGNVWVRAYQNGVVAVNPGPTPVRVTMGAAGTTTLNADTAAISVGNRVLHS
jgi:hypothetical protein